MGFWFKISLFLRYHLVQCLPALNNCWWLFLKLELKSFWNCFSVLFLAICVMFSLHLEGKKYLHFYTAREGFFSQNFEKELSGSITSTGFVDSLMLPLQMKVQVLLLLAMNLCCSKCSCFFYSFCSVWKCKVPVDVLSPAPVYIHITESLG